MRTEKRIEKDLARLHKSPYRKHYAETIAALEWVLGRCESRQVRMLEIIGEVSRSKGRETKEGL